MEEVHIHSTIVGKIWLTILFIFRMLVLGVAAEDVWDDEQDEFVCNTEQPGCRNVCYDHAFPISLIRYWVLQVIFVSSPSLVYMGHALYRLRALEKERHKKKAQVRVELEGAEFEMPENRKRLERELRQLEHRKLNKAPLRGSLLGTYVIHIFTRSALEVGFMMGQYILYGFRIDPLYKCQRDPCPNIVDCFVSRPTEKTVFIVFMQCIATVSLCLNILEIAHLGVKKIRRGICGVHKTKDDFDYAKKSQKNSVVVHPCIGVYAMPQKTPTSVSSRYHLLMEKPTETAPYAAFCSIQNSHSKMSSDYNGDEQENKLTQWEMQGPKAIGTHPYNSSSNNNDGLNEAFETSIQEKTNKLSSSQASMDVSPSLGLQSWADRHAERSALYSDTTGSLPINCAQRPWGVSYSCSTVAGSGGSLTDSPLMSSNCGQQSPAGNKYRIFGKADGKRASQPDSTDSAEDLSSESKYSNNYNNPQALLSLRRTPLTSNTSRSRATSDLQI